VGAPPAATVTIVIVVLGEGAAGDGSRSLALALRRLGEAVALGALDPRAPKSDDFVTLPCTMASGDGVADLLDRAQTDGDPVHAVVLASVGVPTTEHGELAALDPTQWADRVEIPLRRTLACFQGSHRRLRARGGCLLVLVPTLSLVGAAGMAPWAAVAEAQRALAKSAGRAWGHEGITVNCVAVPAALLVTALRAPGAVAGGVPGTAGPDRPGLPPPSLDRSPSWESDIAPVVASLAAPGWTGVTGATIAVDGGVWMTP